MGNVAVGRRFLLGLLTTSLVWFPQIAAAADFALDGDAEMACYATLTGPLERGDAAKVASVLDEELYHNRGPVCLDSPGGLWAEGLALMELFHERAIPTAVAAGARCESACAIAFLGGSTRQMTASPFRARFLHVEGHLGFHAPYLEVPPGQYDEATVLAAFGRAMEVVTELTAWSERLALSDSFLVHLFSTGQNDMYMIDTVGKAAELSVQLVGHEIPSELSEGMIRDACRQSSTFFGGGPERFDSGATIPNAFRIGSGRSGMQRGVAVAQYSVESWSGWFVCTVGYDAPSGAVPFPNWSNLGRFEGARAILFAQVSDDPIQEWGDPMRVPPEPSMTSVLQVAEPLGEIFFDQSALRVETVFPPDTRINRMRSRNWHQDPPAPMLRTGTQVATTPLPSRQAEPSSGMSYSSFWDHNGSRMGLVAEGMRRRFHYVVPRAALVERGVTPGTLLFDGERIDFHYEGVARIFAAPPCGAFTYPVAGPVAADHRTVTMYGRAPRVNSRCEITGYREDTLVFTLD